MVNFNWNERNENLNPQCALSAAGRAANDDVPMCNLTHTHSKWMYSFHRPIESKSQTHSIFQLWLMRGWLLFSNVPAFEWIYCPSTWLIQPFQLRPPMPFNYKIDFALYWHQWVECRASFHSNFYWTISIKSLVFIFYVVAQIKWFFQRTVAATSESHWQLANRHTHMHTLDASEILVTACLPKISFRQPILLNLCVEHASNWKKWSFNVFILPSLVRKIKRDEQIQANVGATESPNRLNAIATFSAPQRHVPPFVMCLCLMFWFRCTRTSMSLWERTH